jgi:hypothetical protein
VTKDSQSTPSLQDPREQDATRGLARLVLALLVTLKELMERQAKRRLKEGSLTSEQVERLGETFLALNEKIDYLAQIFGLDRSELSLEGKRLDPPDLGIQQIAQLNGVDGEKISVVDLLDSILERGVVVLGDLQISVADVELINVQLRLILNVMRKNISESRKKNLHRDFYQWGD